MSRLSIELNPEQHKKIKTLATLSGASIKKFVLDKIFKNDEEVELSNRPRVQTKVSYNKKELKALYAESAAEDLQLTEEGMADYKTGLLDEDTK